MFSITSYKIKKITSELYDFAILKSFNKETF